MSKTTLWQLLNNEIPELKIKRGIEIPMIQRDYAQGRSNNKAIEIRKVFLNKIKECLLSTSELKPQSLELDFIYGYVDSETFIPLDGQQRLTTLYLIHWYFCFRENALELYKIPLSKFSYQTRKSSNDFFNKLVTGFTNNDWTDIFDQNLSFSNIIANKNWYFVNWKYDQTIKSAITMLDEIDRIFRSTNISLKSLINPLNPPIFFSMLDVKELGLSDDLYIKMNSRGKPLTNFENLKAELGRFIENSDFNDDYSYSLEHDKGVKSVNVETYFVTKADTSWLDYFWNVRNVKTNEFDDKLLNLLSFVSLNEIIKTDIEKFENARDHLLELKGEISFYTLLTLGVLNEDSIISYINTLDLLTSTDPLIKTYLESSVIYLNKKIIIPPVYNNDFGSRYELRILFYGITKFVVKNHKNLNINELIKWDRLLRNLVINTPYNASKNLQDSILAIDKLIDSYYGDIYEQFYEQDMKGFDAQQINEEKLKLLLIKESDKWKQLIDRAEAHGYLDGQIIFILVISGIYDYFLHGSIDKTKMDVCQEQAAYYIKLFEKVFSHDGLLNFQDELFRRALLVKGDYTLYSTNWSFLIDRGRDISWKRLLKESGNRTSEAFIQKSNLLIALFKEMDNDNVQSSLEKVISEHEVIDWRKDFIENPLLMQLCHQKYFKFFDDDKIFLLRKSKYNKYEDPCYKSILLKEALINDGFKNNEIALGYIDSLERYGLTQIKNKKTKIVFNYGENNEALIKRRGEVDILMSEFNDIIQYVKANY